jgi:hypothetical protein
LLLPLQLADAQQQLLALNRHVEAIMVGYAVQALQAGSKAKQATIQQQALREQQEVRGGLQNHDIAGPTSTCNIALSTHE